MRVKDSFRIEFDDTGEVKRKIWRLNFKYVSEETYAKAAATDKTLPPYFKDTNQYKTLVTPEVKALIKRYRAMSPVKIPLEFGDKGEPVAAPPVQE